MAQVIAARIGAGVGQRMLEQGEQAGGRHLRSNQLGHLAQEPSRRGQRQRPAGAVVGLDPPAVERCGDLPGERAVGGDERGALSGLDRLAQHQRDGARLGTRARRLDQRHAARRFVHTCERRALLLPPVRHRRGSQRQRDKRVASRVRRYSLSPGRDAAGPGAQCLHQPGEAELRVVFGGQPRVLHELVPDLSRLFGVVSGQDHRPLRQMRDCLHQELGRATRPGRADHQHRGLRRGGLPGRDQPFDHPPLPRLDVRRLAAVLAEKPLDHVEKGEAALPVAGEIAHVETADRVRVHALALHFVDQPRKAVGESVDRGARGEIRLRVEQPGDEFGQFQPAAQRRDRGRQVGKGGVAPEIGDEPDPRQQPGGARVEQRGQPPFHPPRVDVERDLGERLGRCIRHPVDEPCDHLGRVIDPGRQGKEPRGLGELKHRARPGLHPPAAPRRR